MSKQEILSVVNALPDDVSFEDVLYKLYVIGNIKAGLEDARAERVHTHDEVKEMFAWNPA
jgi:predicted transcriptional regulator